MSNNLQSSFVAAVCIVCSSFAHTGQAQRHVIVDGTAEKWSGIPANHCSPNWQWGNEILIAYERGEFDPTPPIGDLHNLVYSTVTNRLARSTDGGATWTHWDPPNWSGDRVDASSPPGGVNFQSPGFLMKLDAGKGNSFMPSHSPDGAWLYSTNKGATWNGPYTFRRLFDTAPLNQAGMIMSSRTAYIVNSPSETFLFMSAGHPAAPSSRDDDRAFMAKTTDGGGSFEFVSWIVNASDPYRAVMPSPVRITSTIIVCAIRRRERFQDFPRNEVPRFGIDRRTRDWIDLYRSTDNGSSWAFLTKIADTGPQDVSNTALKTGYNGNPPALIKLSDGRLACSYGKRWTKQIAVKYSQDNGGSWSAEQIIADDFVSADLGYSRLYQRTDGKLVCLYFMTNSNNTETDIRATLFSPTE